MGTFQTTLPQFPRTKEKVQEERLVLDRELRALHDLRDSYGKTWGDNSWDRAVDKLIAHFEHKIETIDLELARYEHN